MPADWRSKGLWLPGGDSAAVESVLGCELFDGPFTWPVMVARRSAIEANIAAMARYCAAHDVDHAPHGKTTMAPSLFAAQLAAGAWAITVATAHQALVARHVGVPRVLLANELLDPKVLRWAADEVAAGWEFLCYVDSPAAVEVAGAAVAGRGGRLRVLVELGFPGGRTGCRSVADAVTVARAVAATDGLDLAGVAAFEGLLPDSAAVHTLLADVRAVAEQIAPLCPRPPILSAGGSLYFDLVVAELRPAADACGGRLVLRSGAVVSHDDGVYAAGTPFRRAPAEGALAAALQVWAQVLATPEPGLSIVGAGKRDLPFDEGMPVPLRVRRPDGSLRPLPGARVERINDQHAYVRDAPVRPGDLMHLGISHPCTAFDKWRVIPVVDDDYRVVDLIHTYF
ncbi:MAG: alanine racemase [Micromonosporaceae bacterium]